MKSKEEKNYPFSWIENIVESKLNPKVSRPPELSPKELEVWHQLLRTETGNIWKSLKLRTFRLLNRKKITVVLAQYQECLQELRRQSMVNMAAYPEDDPLNKFCGQLLSELDMLQEQLKRKYAGFLAEPFSGNKMTPASLEQPELRYKVTCNLSVDQIGILLKAGDDTRLLSARSFSLVLRSIIPYLSTERMENFSWKSARTSTVKMEQRDKDAALEALERLVAKVKEY
jgi:hypothetical protein